MGKINIDLVFLHLPNILQDSRQHNESKQAPILSPNHSNANRVIQDVFFILIH